jgi:hypothetical protein
MAVGIAIGAWRTGGFKSKFVSFELPPEAMRDAEPASAKG